MNCNSATRVTKGWISFPMQPRGNVPHFALDQPSNKTEIKAYLQATQWKSMQVRSQTLALANSTKGSCGFPICGCKFTCLTRGALLHLLTPQPRVGSQPQWARLETWIFKTRNQLLQSKHRFHLISFTQGWITQICLNLKYSSGELSLPAAADSCPPSPAEPRYSWIFYN